MVDFDKLTKKDCKLAGLIATRAIILFKWPQSSLVGLQMDISAVRLCEKVNIEKLMTFDDVNFGHDVGGINI